MSDNVKASFKGKDIDSINVAIAVIHYHQHYLLGFRNSMQHQGDRYEFVGGKIEADESAKEALIREVVEETGIDISKNTFNKLGCLTHNYKDKQVTLQVYKIEMTAKQYEQHEHCDYGLEGQALFWVDKSALLAGHYQLPAANKTILEWL
ncbi:NUDIX domain-containing protein [uncultured Psychrobacter sp.]|uniref:NUDIX domain-containing protein n=1 Tax=uncultured Psychrobacter sp. TaxID=259303 RepID=UPI00345879AD